MKKAVFITYNQALTERVAFLLDQLQIKGFTQWPLVNGAGTETGEPRMGSHTWPEMKLRHHYHRRRRNGAPDSEIRQSVG